MRVAERADCELTELDHVLEELLARDDYEPIRDVVGTLVARMRGTLRHLIDIGVGYLSLNRGVPTLSGGESQRVKMARQLDCDLVDLIYILDEPTVGLHPRDIDHLIAMLGRLRDHGNSVLVVEHDPAVIRAADWIVDIGPRAGEGGGELAFSGRLEDLLCADSATSRALNDPVATPGRGRRTFDDAFRIENATSSDRYNPTCTVSIRPDPPRWCPNASVPSSRRSGGFTACHPLAPLPPNTLRSDAGHRAGAMDYALARARLCALRA